MLKTQAGGGGAAGEARFGHVMTTLEHGKMWLICFYDNTKNSLANKNKHHCAIARALDSSQNRRFLLEAEEFLKNIPVDLIYNSTFSDN